MPQAFKKPKPSRLKLDLSGGDVVESPQQPLIDLSGGDVPDSLPSPPSAPGFFGRAYEYSLGPIVEAVGEASRRAESKRRGSLPFELASLVGEALVGGQERAMTRMGESVRGERGPLAPLSDIPAALVPAIGPASQEAGENIAGMIERGEYGGAAGATTGFLGTMTAPATLPKLFKAAPAISRVAAKPVQAPLQALYQIFGDPRKRPTARLGQVRLEAAGVKRATRGVDKAMTEGFGELDAAIPGPVTDTVGFRNIMNESAAEFGLDPKSVPTPKTFAQIEAGGGGVGFQQARRALREMYRDAHRGAPDRQVRAALARSSERIMDEVLQPAADAVSPEFGKFYGDMRRSYSEYARDFLNKDSVGADLLDAIEQAKKGSTRPMLALFQDPVKGVQVRGLLGKYEVPTAPMDKILSSTLAESRMPTTWDDPTRLMSERGAKATRLQEISSIQQKLGGGEAIRPGFTQYAAGIAQLIASIPLRYIPGFRQFLLWGESDVAPAAGRLFKVPKPPPMTAPLAPPFPPTAAPLPGTSPTLVPPGADVTPPPAVGATLAAAPDMLLRNQLARDQFGKSYLKLTPQERQLVEQLAADAERTQP